jgi:ferredoxin
LEKIGRMIGMIFYFSGTGNSLYTAKNIGESCNERVISIAEEMKKSLDKLEYTLEKDELIGFVYPVYAWAPPKIVVDFIEKIKIKNYKNNYVFSIATCGANVGNTMKVLEKALSKKEITLNSGFSFVMPSNYIIMGDVDSKEVEEEKLAKADERLKKIDKIIKERENNIFDVEKGSLPVLLTAVINPLFTRFGINIKKFHADDNCTGCGLCEKVCSVGNISVDKKPVWGSKCTQCLACINRCPTKAIQYGESTIKKGRYKNPKV